MKSLVEEVKKEDLTVGLFFKSFEETPITGLVGTGYGRHIIPLYESPEYH